MLRSAPVVGFVFLVACSGASGGGDDSLDPHASVDASLPDVGGGLTTTTDGSNDGEICGNGLDDNGDGEVDEGCACTVGQTEACWPGDPKDLGKGICTPGTMTCMTVHEFTEWGPCVGAHLPGKDGCTPADDAATPTDTGAPDTSPPPPPTDAGGCTVDVTLDVDGDCVKATCPPEAPYVVGCAVTFIGDTPCGCVANAPGSPFIFLKEGKICDAGHLTGTLKCSCAPGAPLDATNCPINKKWPYYPTSAAGCPTDATGCPI